MEEDNKKEREYPTINIEDLTRARPMPKGRYDIDKVLGPSRRVRIRRNREADREAENKKIALEGPIMKIRISHKVLLEFQSNCLAGCESSLSEWLNEAMIEYIKIMDSEEIEE